jgi:predicted transcriptional regulator
MRRSREENLIAILQVVAENENGELKTRIMGYAEISNYAQFTDYLNLLLGARLIEDVRCSNKTRYRPTEKGLRFLGSSGPLMEVVNELREKSL